MILRYYLCGTDKEENEDLTECVYKVHRCVIFGQCRVRFGKLHDRTRGLKRIFAIYGGIAKRRILGPRLFRGHSGSTKDCPRFSGA